MLFNKLNQILENNTVFSAAKLDGFLAAIISSPNLIHPLKWIEITKVKDFNLAILVDFYEQIYLSLRNDNYLPVFIYPGVEDISLQLDRWKDGYILGKNLWDPKIVKIYKVEIDEMLSKIYQLSSEISKNPDNFINVLSKTCIDIYKFWSIHYS